MPGAFAAIHLVRLELTAAYTPGTFERTAAAYNHQVPAHQRSHYFALEHAILSLVSHCPALPPRPKKE
jgi:hypothetical protein